MPTVTEGGTPGTRLAGRDAELARVDAFVTASESARGLLIRGAAGIGKTSIWWAALDRLRAARHVVLSPAATPGRRSTSFVRGWRSDASWASPTRV